jgi:7-cyano-7-deazaguanine tRNA-ribosyltransferase
MSKLDFGIYAIGGVVKTFMDYRFDLDVSILLEVRKYLTPSRPLHMFGLGLPTFFSLAVACGADTFDSAAYILYAKDGRYFSHTGTKNINDLVEFPCNCPVCAKYTPKELQQSDKAQQLHLLASHNLYFSFAELKTIRQSIREGTLWDLVEQRVQAHPKLVEAFGIIHKYPEYFNQLLNANKIKGLKESNFGLHYRPEVQKAIDGLAHFTIPKTKTTLIFLPELDLPSKSSNMVSKWIEDIIKSPKQNEIQIFLVSNLFGAIPFELMEIYPLHQHESIMIKPLNQIKDQQLGENICKMIKSNQNNLHKVHILVPNQIRNQFNEEINFESRFHLISSMHSLLFNKFASLTIKVFTSLEELLNG